MIKRDRYIVSAITIIAIITALGVWWFAPARHSHLEVAAEPYSKTDASVSLASAYHSAWTHPDASQAPAPLIAEGLLISSSNNETGSIVEAINVADNTVHWSYQRNVPLCAAQQAWGNVILVYKTARGCGDVVSLKAATGQYAHTRSANAEDTVQPIRSNDNIGTISAHRVELWRSDLVRTVEYGEVEAPQEPDMQPREGCTMQSALSRTKLLTVLETCDSKLWLSFQNTTPEDSRKPEVHANAEIETDAPKEARLVAMGQEHAVVYIASPTPQLVVYNKEGNKTFATSEVKAAPEDATLEDATLEDVLQPVSTDLPHHITWFSGAALYLFTPENMEIKTVFEDAIGPGIALNGQLLYPTVEGLALADWNTGEVQQRIPVDRDGYQGAVSLQQAEGTLIELRGTELVALASA